MPPVMRLIRIFRASGRKHAKKSKKIKDFTWIEHLNML